MNNTYLQSLKLWFILYCTIFFSGCGGSGDGASNTISQSDETQITIGVNQSFSMIQETSSVLTFDATHKTTYKIELNTISGYASVQVFSEAPTDTSSPIVTSVFFSNYVEFTAAASQTYYIKLTSEQSGSFFINTSATPENLINITPDITRFSFESISSFGLSNNQTLLNPLPQPVMLSVSTSADHRITDIELPIWLQRTTIQSSSNERVYELQVTSRDLSPGLHNDVMRLLNAPNQNIRIFKEVDLEYKLDSIHYQMTINPPTEVNDNELTTYQVDVTNDTAVSFKIHYGPAGMNIDSSGLVSWTPSSPMFNTNEIMNWGVVTTDQNIKILQTGSIDVLDTTRKVPLVRSGIVVPNKDNGLTTGDFNNDGKNEILLFGNNRQLYTLTQEGNEYVQDWHYPWYLSFFNINSIAAHDINNDGFSEFFVSVAPSSSLNPPIGTEIFVLDGVTRKISRTFTDGLDYHTAFQFGDFDGDNVLEFAYLSAPETLAKNFQVMIYDSSTFELEWQSGNLTPTRGDFNKRDMEIGNVDNDILPELILATGYVIGFDSVTGTYGVEWDNTEAFGNGIDVGNIDGVGPDEIVATGGSTIKAFNAVEKSKIFETQDYGGLQIYVENVDNDIRDEIIIYNFSPREIRSYTYNEFSNSLDLEWSTDALASGISNFTVDDIDNDNNNELIWATGVSSTTPDAIVIASLNTQNATVTTEWVNQFPNQLPYGFIGAHWLKTASNRNEVVFTTPATIDWSVNGDDGARILSVDPTTGFMRISDTVYGNGFGRRSSMAAGDIDNDGVDEIFLSGYRLGSDMLALHRNSTDFSIWDTQVSSGVIAIDSAKIDSDNATDFAVITAGGITVYNGATQIEMWSGSFDGIPTNVKIADTDFPTNGQSEIIVTTFKQTPQGRLYRLMILERTVTDEYSMKIDISTDEVSRLVADDIDGDGKIDIFTSGGYGANIIRYDNLLNEISRFTLKDTIVKQLFIEDLPFNRKNLMVYYDKTLKTIDPTNGQIIWESPSLISDIEDNSLHYADTNNDGRFEIMFGTRDTIYISR